MNEEAAGAADEVTANQDLAKIRERVLNVVGHELRTPVSTVRGLAEALSQTDAGNRDQVIEALVRSAKRLEALVNDLLLAAGVTTVLPTSTPEPVAVVGLVRSCWTEDGGLVVEADEDLSVLMDAASARRVVERVLANAAAYGDRPVVVTARRSDAQVKILVDSPGASLHPEELRLAFEPFYRGEHAVMSTPGLGLGLAVVRALVEHAGGSVSVQDRPGGGLLTRILLPAAQGG